MTPEGTAGRDAVIEALRFALGYLDAMEGRPQRFTAAQVSPQGLAGLGGLVIGARAAVAQLQGITDPAAQLAEVRKILESELEQYTLGALGGDPGP